MIDYQFNGIPLHVLLVHLVVIVVPLAALCLLLSAFWPTARRRLGFVTPLVALVALVAVPFAVAAGEWLRARVAPTPLIESHTTMAPSLLGWVIAVFGVASAQWLWYSLAPPVPPRLRLTAAIVIDSAALVTAVGSVVTVVLVGESGSAAVWTGSFG
ncbi:MAG: hypothetical protein KF692_03390 [Cryobacterium sp.]|nr:hypothetical protein [Micrococcales bacterium]MBX3078257.1 hypothetical protein [Cryobacterium sp.]HNP15844.1 hypothetical protein [Terrimesophilobacter sp.]